MKSRTRDAAAARSFGTALPTGAGPGAGRSRSRLRVCAALALLLALAACGREPGNGALAAARIDTIGGVVQVTNPARAPEWRLEPVVAFGGLGLVGEPRPEDFGALSAVLADADGNIYVGEAQSREIRVFDRTGRHLRTFGRRGGGPGEMQSVQSLAWQGDTLLVLDPGNARMQRFLRNGAEAGTMRWLPLTGPVDWVRFFPAADGRVHVRGLPQRGANGVTFVTYDGGTPVDSVFAASPADPPPSSVRCDRPDGAISFFTIPFAPRAVSVPAAAGRALVSWSADYRIHWIDAAGDTLRRVVRELPHPRIADAEWTEASDSFAAFRGRMPPGTRCEPSSIVRPAVRPILRALHFDQEGRLVVEVDADDGVRFDFHDADGRLTGSVRAPDRDPRIPPYFRDDHLYVVTRHPDHDVQGVAVYAVRKDAG